MPGKTSVILSAFVIAFAVAADASTSFTGSYNYGITGETTALGCTAASPVGGNPWTDNFASTSGSNSVESDPVSFSICDGTPGYLEDGTFLITDGAGDAASGIFSGTLTGNTLGDGTGGDIFDGNFTILSATGNYLGDEDAAGLFQVVTGAVNTPAFTSGTINFQQTPEPASALLCGAGLLFLIRSRRFLHCRG